MASPSKTSRSNRDEKAADSGFAETGAEIVGASEFSTGTVDWAQKDVASGTQEVYPQGRILALPIPKSSAILVPVYLFTPNQKDK